MDRVSSLYITAVLLALVLPVALPAQPTLWQSSGIGGGNARLFRPTVSPHNPSDIIVPSALGMLYRTTDFGRSWRQYSFQKISVDRFDPTYTAFTDTPSHLFTISAAHEWQVVKSTDNGESWERLPADPPGEGADFVSVDPKNEQRIFIATGSGYYYSWDGGATYVQRYRNNVRVYGAYFDGEAIYLATGAGMMSTYDPKWTSFKTYTAAGGVPTGSITFMTGGKQRDTVRLLCIASDFLGRTTVYTIDPREWAWTGKRLTLPTGFTAQAAGMARNNIRTLYVAGRSTANGQLLVYRSNNAGVTWDTVFFTGNNRGIRTGWVGQNGDLAWPANLETGFTVAPGDSATAVLTHGGFVYTTTNAGASWRQAYVDTSGDHPANAPTPKGASYASTGIELTNVWGMAWADSSHIFAAYSNYRGILSTDGGATWGFGYSGLTHGSVYRVVSDSSTGTLYAATSSARDLHRIELLYDNVIDTASGSVMYSTNKGKAWKVLHDFRHAVTWVTLDPRNTKRMYACVAHSTEGGIYVSNDIEKGSASQWTKLSNPLGTAGRPYNLQVLKDGALLTTYCGRVSSNAFTFSSGIYISTDGGTSWESRTIAPMQFWTADVAVDPHDNLQKTWYVCVYGGANEDYGDFGGLYRTTDRGLTWKRIFVSEGTASCIVNPRNANELYITTTTGGLWFSPNVRNEDPIFTPVESYPYHTPTRVFFDPYFLKRIWVTSAGSGIGYFLTLPPPTAPILLSPTNGTSSVPTAPVCYWRAIPTVNTYRLQISTQQDFSTLVLDSTGIAATEAAVGTFAMNTTYYWRVKGVNDAGSGPWSEIWRFTTEAPAQIGTPALRAPSDDTTGVRLPYMFTWDPVQSATQYQIEIARDASITDIVHTAWVNAPIVTQSIAGLESATRYYWHVRAANPADTGNWSPVWRFTTETVSSVGTPDDVEGLSLRITTPAPVHAFDHIPIEITLPRAGIATVVVVNTRGEKVATPLAQVMSQGAHRISWNASAMPSGAYFVTLLFEQSRRVERCVLVK